MIVWKDKPPDASSPLDADTLNAAFAERAPFWAPLTVYTIGQQVVSPGNDVVSATVAHTSSAAYATDVANWSGSSTYALVAEPVSLAETTRATTAEGLKARRPLSAGVGTFRCPLAATVLSGSVLAEGLVASAPFVVTATESYDRITLEVTSAGTAGALVRVGIYNVNESTGIPTTLVLDAGTVAGTIIATNQITIAVSLSPGTYALCAVVQGGAATRPIIRTFTPIAGMTGVALPYGSAASAWTMNGITGALPGTHGTVAATTIAPLIYLRRSA